jgi:hypothetical protein
MTHAEWAKRGVATALLTVALVSCDAAACSCVPPGQVPQQKAQSTRVFSGRVVKIERLPRDGRHWFSRLGDWFKALARPAHAPEDVDVQPHRQVTFQVEETFKGPAARRIQVTTGMGGGDCGYPFDVGQTYVVYAHGSLSAPATGICSLTGMASEPRSGLGELRALAD